jgi:hypothetical protein
LTPPVSETARFRPHILGLFTHAGRSLLELVCRLCGNLAHLLSKAVNDLFGALCR